MLADPPAVHPEAEDGVWRTESACYRFMAEHVTTGCRTLETGAGVSTVLFAAWGCDHVAVVPAPEEIAVVEAYCRDRGISLASVRFDPRPSETALPELAAAADEAELDLVLVDGCHGFPMPVIDWFYAAGRLRAGGVLVLDDVQLPQVDLLVDQLLERDDRWQRLATTRKWVAYRRLSSGPLGEGEWAQTFFVGPPEPPAPRALWLKRRVPSRIRRALARTSAPRECGPGHSSRSSAVGRTPATGLSPRHGPADHQGDRSQ